MRRRTWLILAAVVVVGWLARGIVPYTKTIWVSPNDPIQVFPPPDPTAKPVAMKIHCNGLLRSDVPYIYPNSSTFSDNPCRSGLAAKRVEWATILATLLTGCGLVISRNRSQQRIAAAAAAPQPTPTNDHPG